MSPPWPTSPRSPRRSSRPPASRSMSSRWTGRRWSRAAPGRTGRQGWLERPLHLLRRGRHPQSGGGQPVQRVVREGDLRLAVRRRDRTAARRLLPRDRPGETEADRDGAAEALGRGADLRPARPALYQPSACARPSTACWPPRRRCSGTSRRNSLQVLPCAQRGKEHELTASKGHNSRGCRRLDQIERPPSEQRGRIGQIQDDVEVVAAGTLGRRALGPPGAASGRRRRFAA